MALSPETAATLILLIHLAVVAFNVFGLVAIPLGKWLGWGFVQDFWWRFVHVLTLAVVAVQAVLGRACFLTLWENALRANADAAEPPPMLAAWINSVLYWPLPLGVFAAICLRSALRAAAVALGPAPRRRGQSSFRLSARHCRFARFAA